MKRKAIECIRAAHDELIRLSMLIDKNKPLHGRTMWMPNPKFTAEAQLTAEQRKALIESGSTGSDLQEKLESAARFVNIDSRIDQSERAMKVWCRAYVVKFNELCAFLAAQYGFDPDPAKLSDQQRNRIAGEVEALTKSGTRRTGVTGTWKRRPSWSACSPNITRLVNVCGLKTHGFLCQNGHCSKPKLPSTICPT